MKITVEPLKPISLQLMALSKALYNTAEDFLEKTGAR
jgi:hypothetical protein